MTRIAIAPDSFKGNLTAGEAAACIAAGLKRALVGIQYVSIPMADGGEGTVAALVEATGGRYLTRRVQDPLGRGCDAVFGITGDGQTAVIEMAAASGLTLLKPAERNPLRADTYGTGELIRQALELGVRRILIGLGGSATCDGGMGLAKALGVRFLDADGRAIGRGGGALARLARIDMRRLDPRLAAVEVEVACDVDNPLIGPRGAARVYGPQKGATPAAVETLDAGLANLAECVARDVHTSIRDIPGSGAAGGLGGGLLAFARATLRPGVDIVIDAVQLERRLRGCALVITGEGRMDYQTACGKTPTGVAKTAKRLGLPVIAICGSLGENPQAVHAAGIDVFFSSLETSIAESEIPIRGPAMLTACAEQVGRLLALQPNGIFRCRRRRTSGASANAGRTTAVKHARP